MPPFVLPGRRPWRALTIKHLATIPPVTRHTTNRFCQHEIELAMASADVAGLIERIGGIEPIIRGAAYSRTQAVDVSFVGEVSSSSPLFNHPVVAIQRGRDHGKHRRSYSSAADAARRVRGVCNDMRSEICIAPYVVFECCCAVSSWWVRCYGCFRTVLCLCAPPLGSSSLLSTNARAERA